jgi:hypothetical protein
MYDTDIESIPPDKCFTFATRPPRRRGWLIADDLLASAWARCEFFVVEVFTRARMRGICPAGVRTPAGLPTWPASAGLARDRITHQAAGKSLCTAERDSMTMQIPAPLGNKDLHNTADVPTPYLEFTSCPGLLDDRYCAMGRLPGKHGRPHHACTGHLRAPTLVSDASQHVHLNGITNSATRLRMSPSVRADGGREEYCRAASIPRRPRGTAFAVWP